jgi:hypothetical protein
MLTAIMIEITIAITTNSAEATVIGITTSRLYWYLLIKHLSVYW